MKMGETKNIMEKTELVKRHLPVLYMDRREPFPLLYIGYTVFHQTMPSASSGRRIDLAQRKAAICIEYAYYYDYDIQHLYDLEHLWVYLDDNENVCGCECSFHGMYLNAMLPGVDILRGENRVHMYVQPGKHAFLPRPELFHLFIDFWEACAEKAGNGGILTPDIVPGLPLHSEEDDRKMGCFIKERFSFVPSEEYEVCETTARIMPWEELRSIIPERICREMENRDTKAEGTAWQ